MFEDKLTKKETEKMEILYLLVETLCVKYMLDTGKQLTPFEMVETIILATFEEVFEM